MDRKILKCEMCSYKCELKIGTYYSIPTACPYLNIIPEWKYYTEKNPYKRFEYFITILTFIWILSWFGAIWIYTIHLFLTGLFALILALISNSAYKDMKNGKNI